MPYVPYVVYRLYDDDRKLLYIGCSTYPTGRLARHRRKPWGKRIASFTLTYYPNTGLGSQRAAEHVEHAAILSEQPEFNTRWKTADYGSPSSWPAEHVRT